MSRVSPRPQERSTFSECAGAFGEEIDYVYRTLRRLGVPAGEAEDLVQEAFVIVWRRWRDFEPGRALRPWLAGIARHVARDHSRRSSRREIATEAIEHIDEAPGPEDLLASARARALALRALELLPERHRAVLIRYELDGLSIRELAEEWSMPFFTVAARLRRARLRFAKVVKQLQVGERKDTGGVLSPSAVLAAERVVAEMPATARTRVREKLAFFARGLPAPAATWGRGNGKTVLRIDPALPGRAHLLANPRPLRTGRIQMVRPFLPRPLTALALAALVASVLLGFALWERPAAAPLGAASGSHLARSAPAHRSPHPSRVSPPRIAAVVSPPTPAAAPDPRARGLVGQWRLDDGPGNLTARDSSGNGRPCLLHNLDADKAWTTGPVGGAIDLGKTGWLECPLPEARTGVPFELSAALWIQRVVPPHGRETVLLTRQLPRGDPAHLFWFGVREQSLALWSHAFYGRATAPLPSLETWTHITFVHSGPDTRLYVNGALAGQERGHKLRTAPVPVQSSLTIGGTRYRPDPLQIRHHFDGQIDEIVIYDRVLSDAEVAALAKRD